MFFDAIRWSVVRAGAVHFPLIPAAEFLPIDLAQLIGISMSMLLVLIPVIGATIRFAGKPFVEALLKLGVGQVFDPARSLPADAASQKDVELLSRRVLELEQELNKLKGRGQVVAIADVTGDGEAARRAVERIR